MTLEEILDGLKALGFNQGYVVGGEPVAITLWENEAKQPTEAALKAAAPEGAYQREYRSVQAARQTAYAATCDPLFFGAQRGENTEQEWLDAVEAVKAANPYPVAPKAKK